MGESVQHKLDRIRSPRVHITYDVEIGDAVQKKELPLVVGIMADLSGMPEEELPKIKDRKFVEIDRDNINDVLASGNARISYSVPNKLKDDNSRLGVELNLKSMDDLEPINILKQVEPLKKLYEARVRLSDLVAKLDGNANLEELLQDALQDTGKLKEIQTLAQKKAEEAEGAKEAEGGKEEKAAEKKG